MRLVDYDDSDSDSASSVSELPAPPPPLPAAFYDLYAAPPRQSRVDDRSLHGGRTRLVPHVEGNWAAHVYLEWHPPRQAAEAISALLAILSPSLTSSLYEPATHVPQPLHISLSAPLIVTTPEVDRFREAMVNAMTGAVRHLGRIVLYPTGLAWHANFARTRGFAVLRVKAEQGLEGMLAAANGVAQDFGCHLLYAGQGGERFHLSIAWGLEPELYPEGEVELDRRRQILLDAVMQIPIDLGEVKVKIGREIVSVPFGRSKKA